MYDIDKNEFLVSRDVVFEEDVFPMANDGVCHTSEQETRLPSDDDWHITPVAEDRGSENLDSGEGEIVSDVVSRGKDDGGPSHGKQVTHDAVVVDASAPVVETSPAVTEAVENTGSTTELGRGQRDRQMPAKYSDYMLYNARMLQNPDPHHTLIAASNESSTVQGTTYPLDNFVSDLNFSPAHQAFLAAVTKEV